MRTLYNSIYWTRFLAKVAMIGSIVLTLRDRTGVRRQIIGVQLERNSSSTVLKEVESGEGVDI